MSTHTGRHFLQIPGPTNVPERVLRAIDSATIDHRGPEFQKLGHEVRTIGVFDEPGMIIDEIKTNPPDVVFNLTEHFNAVSAYDRNVAGLLEMMGVPYTGSSPTGLTLCKNKGMAKELLAYHKIRVPNFLMKTTGSIICQIRWLGSKLKPRVGRCLNSSSSRLAV